MTSQAFLMTLSVTSFDCKFQRVFDQQNIANFFLISLNFFLISFKLGELNSEFSRLKVKNCAVSKTLG